MAAPQRDPDRIPEVLAAIEAAWRLMPDLRLGQVLNLACLAIDYPQAVGPMVLLEEEQIVEGLVELRLSWENAERR